MKKDWRETDIKLGEVHLKEVLSQLIKWVENKVQEVPFKGGSETFRREWDFQIAEKVGHIEITAKISQIKRRKVKRGKI